jgi:hypothetical protein
LYNAGPDEVALPLSVRCAGCKDAATEVEIVYPDCLDPRLHWAGTYAKPTQIYATDLLDSLICIERAKTGYGDAALNKYIANYYRLLSVGRPTVAVSLPVGHSLLQLNCRTLQKPPNRAGMSSVMREYRHQGYVHKL